MSSRDKAGERPSPVVRDAAEQRGGPAVEPPVGSLDTEAELSVSAGEPEAVPVPDEAASSEAGASDSPEEAAASETGAPDSPDEAAESEAGASAGSDEAAAPETGAPDGPEEAAASETGASDSPDEALASAAEPKETEAEPAADALSSSGPLRVPLPGEADELDDDVQTETTRSPSSPEEPSASDPETSAEDVEASRPEPKRKPLFRPVVVRDPLLGQELGGRYRIDSRIGAGGMATVYKARQLSVNRDVAVKVLRGEVVDETLVKRFLREARAASKLRSRHSITIIDFGETDESIYYMAMELLQGRTLHDIIADDAPMEPRRAVRIVRHICLSLREAHSLGIIHRDLKPANISLEPTEEGEEIAKVLDFGIAKWHKEGTSRLTMAGSLYGTPRYMSPEQCQAHPLDHRADLYSVGVMLYEMLAGRPPFDTENPASLIVAQVTEEPPPIQDYAPKLPRDLARVVHRLLEKSPEARYQSSEDLIRGLDALSICRPPGAELQASSFGAPVLGRDSQRHVPTAQVKPVSPSAAVLPVPEPPSWDPPRRRWPWMVIPAALTVMLGIGVLLWGAGKLSMLPPPPSALASLLGSGAGAPVVPPAAPDAGPADAGAGADLGGVTADAGAPDAGEKPLDESATVAILLRTVPSPAFVVLNGVSVRETPVKLDVMKQKKPIQVRFQHEGYISQQRSVIPNRDQVILVKLLRSKGAKKPK